MNLIDQLIVLGGCVAIAIFLGDKVVKWIERKYIRKEENKNGNTW